MIKLSVMYPNNDGATFNMDYYCNRHMPLVRQLLSDKLKGLAVDQGIAALSGSPPPFLAMGHLDFESMADLEWALATHGPTLMADIPNYTNTQATIQISEIKI